MNIRQRSHLTLVFAAITAVVSASAATNIATATTSTTTNSATLAWHAGYFAKNMCPKDARSFAKRALENNSFVAIYTTPNAVLGRSGDWTTMVEVSYTPAQTNYSPNQISPVYFTVTGTSADSSSAESGRNRVRESIVKQRYFDTC
ncbi:hypothetical protein [Nonomuraea sediminis]|uniref:hypothetical protein n=1 Tax=Nonomuraea sediminis TaxID=2835864 RepID=UPI001BDC0977|nr:hypothetical protein [Nonomuraea sediminis]